MDYTARLRNDRFIVFLFHGVIERQRHRVRNYTRKHLEKDYFAALLARLKTSGNAVSMDMIEQAHRLGERLPPRSFALTFDDGFENNLTIAAPVLADLGLPATFYVTTGFIEDNRMAWIDRIEWAIENHTGATLATKWGSVGFDRRASSKRAALDQIRAWVKSDGTAHPDRFADDIQRQLGLAKPVCVNDDPLDRKLTWHQVKALASAFTIGCHTRSHAILSFLNAAELHEETQGAIADLAAKTGIYTRHFSYPEGLAHCYNSTVIEKLKACAIVTCPTAEDGDNDVATDLFRLRRVMAI